MDSVPSWVLALVGAFVLALVAEEYPKFGGALLCVVVLGMLLAAQQRGYLNA